MSNQKSAARLGNAMQKIVVLATFVLLSVLAAESQTVHAVCLGSTAITFTPGLQNSMPANGVLVQELDTYSHCVSSDPTITAASDVFVGTLPLSCNVPNFVATADLPVTWNNGKTSTFRFTFTTKITPDRIIILGKGFVLSGVFSGATALVQYDYLHPNDQRCDTAAGVTSAGDKTALQIFTMP